MTNVAIFSDLHLSRSKRSEHENLFVKTLQELREQDVSELWLLGDIFDLMVGPFPFWKEIHRSFFEELGMWTREKRPVVWVQGNHDFFLEALLEKAGIIVSDDFVIRELGGKRVFLAHGDLVNSEDEDYLKWRAFTRNPLVRRVLEALPAPLSKTLILRLGEKLSDKSRAQSRDEGRKGLEELFKVYAADKWGEGYTGVCLGHSHIESFEEQNGHFYVNLGSWINYSPRYALWNPAEYNCPKRIYVRTAAGLST